MEGGENNIIIYPFKAVIVCSYMPVTSPDNETMRRMRIIPFGLTYNDLESSETGAEDD